MVSNFTLRAENVYNNHIAANEEDPDSSAPYGLKERSVLNEVHYYHVANGLPPDLVHDLFERIAVNFVSNAIISFIRERLFQLDELKNVILNFNYSETDKERKPQIIKRKPLNSLKVKQIVCKMWRLIRLLPLMIATLVPPTIPLGIFTLNLHS